MMSVILIGKGIMLTKDIRALDILAKAVELGSLRQAAISKGVTSQAASRALAQLEESLGVRLLHRTTRSLSLTEEGKQLLEATQPALAVLDRAFARARQVKDEISGPLRIIGPRSAFPRFYGQSLTNTVVDTRTFSQKFSLMITWGTGFLIAWMWGFGLVLSLQRDLSHARCFARN